MNKRSVSTAAVLMVLGWAGLPAQATPLSFSAIYSSGSSAEEMKQGTIWVADGKIRTEYLDEGHVMAHVIDPTQHTAYLLVPDQGFYEDDSHGGMPALPAHAPQFVAFDRKDPCQEVPGASCSKLAATTVGGRACDDWQFKQADASWTGCIDRQTGLMLRRQLGTQTFELSDVRFGKQRPSLFVVPPGLKLGGFKKTQLGGGSLGPPTSKPGSANPAAAPPGAGSQ